MFGPPTYDKKTKYPEYVYTGDERSKKYHHAAYTYFVMGVVYLLVFNFTMPPHDFGGILEDFVNEYISGLADIIAGFGDVDYNYLVNAMAVGGGLLFLGLSYFIYKEYRKLVILLALIYLGRFVLAGYAHYSDEDLFASVKYVLPLIGITFYMLCRAAWNLKP